MAVLMDITFLDAVTGDLPGNQLIKERQLSREIIRVGDLRERKALDFFISIAKYLVEFAVSPQKSPVEVQHFYSYSRLFVCPEPVSLSLSASSACLRSLPHFQAAGDLRNFAAID
jgi:hypothetical protein